MNRRHGVSTERERGFTLLIAMTITATLLLVSAGIISVAVREAFLTSSARESQYAFYAADTATECAVYWDVKNPAGYSAFATSTASSIYCNKDSSNPSNQFTVGSSAVSNFTMTFLPKPYCASVTVNKMANGHVTIDSHGYNTCDQSNPRRVERAVRVTY